MKRLNLLLLAVVCVLSACNKQQTLSDCNPYKGYGSPLSVVPGLALGDSLSAVLSCNLLHLESLEMQENSMEVDGYFVSGIPAHYMLYFDSVSVLYLARIFPTFDSRDTAYAGQIFSDILEYNRANYGAPTAKRGASSTHAVLRFEWHVCEGLNEVLEYGTSFEWADTATRWINISIYK